MTPEEKAEFEKKYEPSYSASPPIYIVAIQNSGSASLTSGLNAFLDYEIANELVNEYHKQGATYMKIFTIYPQTGRNHYMFRNKDLKELENNKITE